MIGHEENVLAKDAEWRMGLLEWTDGRVVPVLARLVRGSGAT